MFLMENFIQETFKRMDLQQIRKFLLYSEKSTGSATEPYAARLKKACEPIYNRLKELYTNECVLNIACNEVAQALTSYEEVYMEIGMKAGARLLYELLLSENSQLKNDISKEN